jgi:hypothetical protein
VRPVIGRGESGRAAADDRDVDDVLAHEFGSKP